MRTSSVYIVHILLLFFIARLCSCKALFIVIERQNVHNMNYIQFSLKDCIESYLKRKHHHAKRELITLLKRHHRLYARSYSTCTIKSFTHIALSLSLSLTLFLGNLYIVYSLYSAWCSVCVAACHFATAHTHTHTHTHTHKSVAQ